MNDLKEKTLRGGLAKLCGQAANFALRLASLVIMARLLDPRDFGLVAMVTVITGIFGLFIGAGLSVAAVQSPTISNEQFSGLFWVNMLVGAGLAIICVLTAPGLVEFYNEPRLLWVTITIASGFLITAASVQHIAILQRQLRYVALAVIETLAQLSSFIVGVGMALAGFGYWALVGAALTSQAILTICVWSVTRWIPGRPRRDVQIGSMLRFGGTLTLNSLIVYVGYNLEKVLLGRYWGADVLGLYGRAYQLINIPTENLNAAVGGVAFSALSRLQDDHDRFRRYFLNGYTLVNSLTMPITIFSAFFAYDIILTLLGPKWTDAVPIFRLLAPTVMIFGIINPLAWLLMALGLYRRSMTVALVISPLVVVAYLLGLPFGPNGVAFAYSAALTLWVVPHVIWCTWGTPIRATELLLALVRPFFAAAIAAALAFAADLYLLNSISPFLRLVVGGGIMVPAYLAVLLLIPGRDKLYVNFAVSLWRSISHNMQRG